MKVKFNEIKTRNELADFLNIERKTLTNILYNRHVESYYYSFEIPKKSGGYRKIHAPKDVLKIIQKKLSDCLYNYRDQICKDNEIKLNRRTVLCIFIVIANQHTSCFLVKIYFGGKNI